MKYTPSLKRLGWLLSSYLLLIILLMSTDPFHAPLLVVMVPFGLLFIALFMTASTILHAPQLANHFSRKKRLLIAAAIAWLPVMLLIMRSINQLTLRDGLILAIFIGALLFYVARANILSR